ncbi:MAG: GFA family protein [Nitrospirales bacterium]
MAITGECLCGTVKYGIEGKLHSARSCHCSTCRKAYSSQASAYALVDPSEFKWLSGKEKLISYVNKHGVGKQFCSICGSMLCGIVDGKIHGIAMGCLNDDPEIELSMHLYVGSKAKWETIAEGVPQYQEGPPEEYE